MATDSVSTFLVGTRFINQYYNVLKDSPEYGHQFYTDSSTITRLDGGDTHTASNLVEIHSLLTSQHVDGVEVKNLNCQNSLNGGVLLIVSGFLRFIDFTGNRKFTQVFVLAPQDTGYFVLNDILQLDDEISVTQKSVPEIPEINVNPEFCAPSPHLEQRASGYELVEDTSEYVNSVNVEEDTPVDKYNLSDEHQHEEPQPETAVKEAPMEPPPLESFVLHVNGVDDSVSVPNNEPSKVTAKPSYASVLKAAKTESAQPVASQCTVRQNIAPPLEQHHRVQTSAPQVSSSASLLGPQKVNVGSDKSSAQAGELKSVYVRGLPLNVTNIDLEKVFMKFGKIKPKGVFIKNRKEIGICFAFVEFQDMSGVHNALKASPVEVLGNQVVIEERRANRSSSSTRGGATARGRGRGSYQSESRGQSQGSVLGSSDFSRLSH